jgi:hypothetical protein
MRVPRVLAGVNWLLIATRKIKGRRDPFKPQDLNCLFVLIADVKAEAAFPKANSASVLPLPALMQRDPEAWLIGVGNGKPQSEVTAAKVRRYTP